MGIGYLPITPNPRIFDIGYYPIMNYPLENRMGTQPTLQPWPSPLNSEGSFFFVIDFYLAGTHIYDRRTSLFSLSPSIPKITDR